MFGAPCKGKLIIVIEINCTYRAQPVAFIHYTGRCPALNYDALTAHFNYQNHVDFSIIQFLRYFPKSKKNIAPQSFS